MRAVVHRMCVCRIINGSNHFLILYFHDEQFDNERGVAVLELVRGASSAGLFVRAERGQSAKFMLK